MGIWGCYTCGGSKNISISACSTVWVPKLREYCGEDVAKAEYFDIVHQYIASVIDLLLLNKKIIEGLEFAFPWGLVVFWLECLLMRSGMLSGQDCIKLVFPPCSLLFRWEENKRISITSGKLAKNITGWTLQQNVAGIFQRNDSRVVATRISCSFKVSSQINAHGNACGWLPDWVAPENPSVQGCHGLASAEDDQPGTKELRWLHEQ